MALRHTHLIGAVFAALALSHCGFIGSDPSTPIPSDGVARFGEATPIELCVGPARVVAPEAQSGAAAVCVPEGAAAKPCDVDLACAGLERCVCGRCIVEACQGASCGAGRVCRGKRCTAACAADADCHSGERCVSGGCARSCNGNGDCHRGELCDSLDDVCVTRLCSDAVPCGPGAACEPVEITGELHEPSIVTTAEGDLAFVEMRAAALPEGRAIYRARVDPMRPDRWTADPIEPLALSGVAPAALVQGDHLELYFASADGTSIERAVSTDAGRTFTRDALPLLTPSEPWENGWIGSPSVVVRGADRLLAYEFGPRAGVALARLDAGGAVRLGPIVTPDRVEDPRVWRDVSEVGAPHALLVDDALRVYFTARGVEGLDAISDGESLPADPNDSIGLVASRDLKTFDPFAEGPIYARVVNLRAWLGEREAAVRLLDGGAEIVFVGADASGAKVSGLLRAR